MAAPEGARRHRRRARSSGTRGRRARSTPACEPREQVGLAPGSRWGAVLGTAAVGSIGIGDLAERQEDALERLLQSGVPAMLEIGAALKSAQAWEVEAGLIYDDLAWFLYDELWELSATARPELSPSDRGGQIDLLLDPLLDAAVPDGDRAALVVNVFRAVLAARMAPLFSRTASPVAGD